MYLADTRARLTAILLRLNTGLVDIIASCLAQDKETKNKKPIDYAALAVLADSCNIGACCCLRELRARLRSHNQDQSSPRSTRSYEQARAPQKPSGTLMSRYVRHERKKSGPRQTQWMVVRSRSREGRKRAKSSCSRGSSTLVDSGSNDIASAKALATSREDLLIAQDVRRHHTLLHPNKMPQLHAALNDPRKPQALDLERCLKGQPQNNGLNSEVQRKREGISRQRTQKTVNSLHSFASDSTKLGEIPLHQYACNGSMKELAVENTALGLQQFTSSAHRNVNRRTVKPNFISRLLRLSADRRG